LEESNGVFDICSGEGASVMKAQAGFEDYIIDKSVFRNRKTFSKIILE
jgi:hypothetical protein